MQNLNFDIVLHIFQLGMGILENYVYMQLHNNNYYILNKFVHHLQKLNQFFNIINKYIFTITYCNINIYINF